MASDGHPPEPGKKGDVATAVAAAAGPGVNDLDDPQFMCCVCLELLYKPVVISCGHMSCFWCVHKAMHIYQESHCAVCRQPYEHFPSICQLMHHLLLKLEPVDYKRREKEVLEEEKSMQTHSPQIIEFLNSKNNVGNDGENRNEDSKTRPRQEVSLNGSIADEHSKKIKLDDVSCPLCKEMLYQPAVLNCGHVYCVSCLPSLIDEALECHVCGSPHPGDFPNVCLDLDHFLEEYFPAEYESRAQKVQSKKGQCDPAGSSSGKSSEGSSRAQHDEDRFNVHVGVGCDSCGVYPIRGKRYRCQDCTELIGFDLCEACNSLGSKLPPGRFNQQHTPDHRMKLDNSALYRRLLEEVMIQGGAPPGAIMELFFQNQEIEGGNDEGPVEAVIEGPVEAVIEELVAPGAMLHVAVDDPEMEGNGEEDHEV